MTESNAPTALDAQALVGNFRAEDLSRHDLMALTVMSEREHDIVAALENSGQRLLTGPRGSGKSTYLKIAYYQALESDRVLPVYVNYSRSIALEPEFRKSALALPLFRQWILSQILKGTRDSMAELGVEVPSKYTEAVKAAIALVSAVELRRIDKIVETELDLSEVVSMVEECVIASGRRRAVLLLDDAAHAFAPEQQREFFEVFAGLRSRIVSSKAAVYPGVTSYTPRFHIGHDAQLIDVWIKPEQTNYLALLREIAQKRLSPSAFADIDRRENLLEYLSLASFGIPRTLIVMLEQIIEDNELSKTRSPIAIADTAIAEAADNAMKVFTSLESKLPRYKNFVSVGSELVEKMLGAIKEYNESRTDQSAQERSTRIWIEEPVAQEVQRIVGFLEYAGVVRQQLSSISNGDRSFKAVVPHYGLLINRNALGLGRNPSTANAVEALTSRQHTVRVRRRLNTLIGSDFIERCRLNLGACATCGTERENPEARFCSNCGAVLSQASVFNELLDTDVETLPLSEAILTRISQESQISKVKHILLDEENEKLLAIRYIGPKRATRIRTLAEEFVYE